MATTNDITTMLALARQGDAAAADRLYPAVYEHLHALARGYFRRQPPDQTLQATALVHEAYLKLIDQSGGRAAADWRDREHFFAVAARAMRHILVDHARARAAEKRGRGWERVELEAVDVPARADGSPDVLAIDHALTALAEIAPRQAQVVELRFFAGLAVDQIARALEISPRTVDFDWKLARAWLARALSEPDAT